MPDEQSRWYRLPAKLSVNCPYCGKRVTLVPSDGPTAYYQCEKDGLLILPPDGRMRRAETNHQ